MKKMKFGISAFIVVLLSFSSCIEHEVIPAPTPTTNLKLHFNGTINNTDIELHKNLNGYFLNLTKSKLLLAPPQLSSITYFAAMTSNVTPVMIQIGIGSAFWDQSVTPEPTLAIFNNFFLDNLTPTYADLGDGGFEVTFRDANGTIWKSDEASSNPQDVEFTDISQTTNETGDYTIFTCKFNCYVYHTDLTDPLVPVVQSLKIENANFQAWFKR